MKAWPLMLGCALAATAPLAARVGPIAPLAIASPALVEGSGRSGQSPFLPSEAQPAEGARLFTLRLELGEKSASAPERVPAPTPRPETDALPEPVRGQFTEGDCAPPIALPRTPRSV